MYLDDPLQRLNVTSVHTLVTIMETALLVGRSRPSLRLVLKLSRKLICTVLVEALLLVWWFL